MDFIFIENIETETVIGIYPREKVAKQKIVIDLLVALPENASPRHEIADTLNYADIVDRLRSLLQTGQFGLIESLAELICETILDQFNTDGVRIRLSKIGIIPGVKRIGIIMTRQRNPEQTIIFPGW